MALASPMPVEAPVTTTEPRSFIAFIPEFLPLGSCPGIIGLSGLVVVGAVLVSQVGGVIVTGLDRVHALEILVLGAAHPSFVDFVGSQVLGLNVSQQRILGVGAELLALAGREGRLAREIRRLVGLSDDDPQRRLLAGGDDGRVPVAS